MAESISTELLAYSLRSCPICGTHPDFHDDTLRGAVCNIDKPMLRIAVAVRKAARRFLAAIVTDDPHPELSQLDRWDRGER